MSRSSARPIPLTEGFVRHCMNQADRLRILGLDKITPASVAHLLRRSSTDRKARKIDLTCPDDRCRIMARLLCQHGSGDGTWHHVEVIEAYRLRRLSDRELQAMDPDPPKPPTALPENLQAINAFSRFLEEQRLKTQSAPPRR